MVGGDASVLLFSSGCAWLSVGSGGGNYSTVPVVPVGVAGKVIGSCAVLMALTLVWGLFYAKRGTLGLVWIYCVFFFGVPHSHT